MVTIKDVAKEAGVAVGTVSKVINNITVKPQTKILVDDAIKKLGYKPNFYARGFKTNKTNTVAVILPTIWDPFFSELAFNIERNLKKNQMKMILCNSENDKKSEIEYILMAKQNKMDGIIAITYNNIDEYVSDDIAFVSIDRYFSKNISYISSDNFKGGRLAAKKLFESGCRNLAYIGKGSKIDNATRKRRDGFISYCNEKNIKYTICEGFNSKKDFEIMLNNFIENNFIAKIKIDGVFAVTDKYALNFIKKIKNLKINIPDDVQIIGFDGSKSSIEDDFKISTIRQPVELIAKESVKILLKIIESKKVEKEVILPIKFIKGYTTK